MNALLDWILDLFDRNKRARKALLREIIAKPDDDAPRAAYADLLARTGKPDDLVRAEFIQSQLEIARMPDGIEKSRRTEQAYQLFEQYENQWYGWVRNRDNIAFPKRGFIESWFFGQGAVHEADFADAFAREPITELTWSPGDDKLAMLSRLPLLKRIRVLKLRADQPTEADLVTFYSSPNVTGLREFEYMAPGAVLGRPRLDGRVPFAKVMRILCGDSRFADLRQLLISGVEVGDEGALALARSHVLSSLERLGLGYGEIGPTGLRELLGSPVLAKVTSIGLGGNATTSETCENLAESIASSPYLETLSTLVLDDSAFTDQASVRLVAANLPALRRLILMPRNINDSESPVTLPTMTAIGVEHMAAAKWFRGLEKIELSGHPIGDGGARAIAAAQLPRLRELTLMQVGLTPTGLKPLVQAYSGQLQNLQLRGNPIGDVGADIIASVPWPQMVSQPGKSDYEIGIFLGGCGLSSRGKEILSESRSTRLIPSLFLGGS